MADCACNNFPSSLGNVTFGASVGIRTTNPVFPLHIQLSGIGNVALFEDSGSPAYLYLRSQPFQKAMIAFGDTSPANRWTMGKEADNTFGIRIGSAGDQQVLVIDNTGGVGIGAYPLGGQRLRVVGGLVSLEGGTTITLLTVSSGPVYVAGRIAINSSGQCVYA